jgi:Ser/Thr protein kinase RdoA (MazF antagonist)
VKEYKQLTRLGRLRRLRVLARLALKMYGLEDARLTFIQYEGNVTFRVDVSPPHQPITRNGAYIRDRYLLRIHTSSNLQGIASEMIFLDALRHEADLPVPEPVPTLDGKLLIQVSTPGVPQGRIVSLMRWIDARRLTMGFRPSHFHAWGVMAAQLHAFASRWQPPKDFKRPHWDWEGQLGGREFSSPLGELIASMPDRYRFPFQTVSDQAREVMQTLGQDSDAYGLIHGDMYPENVLFKAGQVFPIDFEDCGYGYWMWDIAVVLCSWPWTEEWHWMRDSFLEGYARVRTLPDAQLKYLDLFMAAQYATMVLWATMFIHRDPAMRTEHEAWRDRSGNRLLRYFQRHA